MWISPTFSRVAASVTFSPSIRTAPSAIFRRASEPLAASLARSFIRHFTGDFEGAAYTVTPKIEALARSVALACGLPLYRTQRQKSPGQYPGLGALLPDLRRVGRLERIVVQVPAHLPRQRSRRQHQERTAARLRE